MRPIQTVSAGASGQSGLPEPAAVNGSAPVQEEAETPERQHSAVYIDGYAVVGTLSVGKLDLLEPILEGADPETLKTGVGSVVPDRRPGAAGNYVVAGHRSWTFGKQFSRLDELETGDKIVLETRSGSYTYVVASSTLVEPDDLSVLKQGGNKAELTLITCEPKYNPTHRLIVKAVLDGKTRNDQ